MFQAVFTCFSPYLGIRSGGGGGGPPKELVHNLILQFFTLGSSKIEVFEIYLFHIVITPNDHPSYVKHVLGHIYVFFTLFGYRAHRGWGGGGGGCLPRDWYTTCLYSFPPWAAQR